MDLRRRARTMLPAPVLQGAAGFEPEEPKSPQRDDCKRLLLVFFAAAAAFSGVVKVKVERRVLRCSSNTQGSADYR